MLSSCVAAAMLAGCGGSQPPIGAPGAMQQSRAIATHADARRIVDAAGSEERGFAIRLQRQHGDGLLVSEGKHVGTLKGFYRPSGECVDNAGDVFIANEDTVVEYKHGGKKPIQTLTFPGYASGAVPAIRRPAIWPSHGMTGFRTVSWPSTSMRAVRRRFTRTANMLFVFCGYDNKGNLYVDGQYGEANEFAFAELPKGASKLKSITLNQSLRK